MGGRGEGTLVPAQLDVCRLHRRPVSAGDCPDPRASVGPTADHALAVAFAVLLHVSLFVHLRRRVAALSKVSND